MGKPAKQRQRLADALTDKQHAHGVCRSCSKRKHLVLPGRICHKCIEGALKLATEQMNAMADAHEQPAWAAAVDPKDVLAALDAMDLADD